MISKDIFSNTYPIKKLGEVVIFLDSKRKPVKESERVTGIYPYYGANGLQGWINDYIFDDELILLAEDGGHFNNPDRGVAYKITGKTWVNNHAHVIKPLEDLNIDYLCRVLENYDLRTWITGTTRAKLTKGGASEILIPLPPLSEQKRIADILDKADELRQKRQQSIEKLDELLQATFIDMFGDPITNPKGWEICEVGKVTDCIVPARDKPKSFTGDIPWITTDDLNHLGFTETSKKNIGLTNEEITLAKARLIPKNSVVISCVGNLGLASIASDNFVMNQQLHSFQCGDKILPEFLIFCLPFQKGYMLSRATSTTVPYMNKSVCNSIPVTVPPLDLQKKWKLIFENSNKQKQVLKKQLAQQENLFQSLQQRAFNGEL
jgi:type I restriction enzyme S subunit